MSRAARYGFSIIETVAIFIIIAILLLIAIPQFTRPSLAAVAAPDSVVSPGSFGKLSVKVSDSRGTPQRGVTVRFEAGDDRPPAVRRLVVGDKEKARRRAAISVEAGEIFLVGAHRRRQHLGREFHAGIVDRPHQRNRIFDQPGNLVEQRWILFDINTFGCGEEAITAPGDWTRQSQQGVIEVIVKPRTSVKAA